MFKLNIEHLISTRISYIKLFLTLQSCYINILSYCREKEIKKLSYCLTVCIFPSAWLDCVTMVLVLTKFGRECLIWLADLLLLHYPANTPLTGQNVKSHQMTRLLPLKCSQLWDPLVVHHSQVTCHCHPCCSKYFKH